MTIADTCTIDAREWPCFVLVDARPQPGGTAALDGAPVSNWHEEVERRGGWAHVSECRDDGTRCMTPNMQIKVFFNGEGVEVARSSSTQTLLHVLATYTEAVTALGASRTGDIDKTWHNWDVTTGRGEVQVYDYDRLCGSTDPALTPDVLIHWHVNAIGEGHEAAAWDVARRLRPEATQSVVAS